MAHEQTIHMLGAFGADGVHPGPSNNITRLEILDCNDGSAFILRDFMSPNECQWYIQQAEAFGMEACGYKHSIRMTDRVVAKSEDVANQFFQRVVPFLESSVNLQAIASNNEQWPTGICWTFPRRKWYPVGLNDVFRICRYEPGGFFLPHHDGGHARSDTNRSIKTFMVYLNDNFVGGPTRFYNENQRHYQSGDDEKVIYSYQPQTGDALIFNSAMTHDGGEVLEGRKYILRSEIMYSSIDESTSTSYPPDHDDVDFGPD